MAGDKEDDKQDGSTMQETPNPLRAEVGVGMSSDDVTVNDGGVGSLSSYLPYQDRPVRNALDVFWNTSYVARTIILLAGMHKFESVAATRIYVGCIGASLVACFLVCAINVGIRTAPGHNLMSDFLLAYLHLPSFFAFVFWRGMLYGEDSDHMRRIMHAVGDPCPLSLNLSLTLTFTLRQHTRH